jgi:hypothetical protein
LEPLALAFRTMKKLFMEQLNQFGAIKRALVNWKVHLQGLHASITFYQ